MSIIRLYPTLQADNPSDAQLFYGDILGMDIVMDQGWVRTMAVENKMPVQVTIAEHAGSGAPMSTLSVEVDNFEVVLEKVKAAGLKIEYGPVTEPWGLKRFFVRDPFGNMINILART